MRLAAALFALLLGGCEVYAVPSPITCPGTLQGTFDFVANQTSVATDCFFAVPNDPVYQVLFAPAFVGTVSFASDGTDRAALCKSAPHALPNSGTHVGPDIDVSSTFGLTIGGCTCPSAAVQAAAGCVCQTDSTTRNCSCPVVLEQRIQGTLHAIPGGYDGFDGTFDNIVTPPPTITDRCDCQEPCSFAYALAATTVGSR